MNEVETYLLEYKGEAKDVLLYLHSILTEEFNLKPKYKFKLPFYYGKKWVCYLFPRKDGKIDISFLKGHLLEDWQSELENRGRKLVRSIVYKDLSDVDQELLFKIIQAAIKLDKNT